MKPTDPSKVHPLPAPLPDVDWCSAFRGRLRGWYRRRARDLPWRRTTDPYRVWVSEIMLQQTQVATVEAYFERFVRALPNIGALAAADDQEVLRLWEGLGYYRRATQLHRAARILVEQHDGKFPRDPDALRRLPGIGRYTAGAILSIAFGDRQPILEANTTRLFSRLLAYRGDPVSAEGQRLLWAMAETVLPRRDAGTLNQALMELGSQVCLTQTPQCACCPVAVLCRAKTEELQSTIPPVKQRQPARRVREAAVIVRRRGRVLLVRCPQGGRWAGLWDFPRFAVDGSAPGTLRRELVEKVRRQIGLIVALGSHLTTIKHSVTQFRITLDCYEAESVSDLNGKPSQAEMKWLRPRELESYPLSSTGRKLAKLIA